MTILRILALAPPFSPAPAPGSNVPTALHDGAMDVTPIASSRTLVTDL